MVFLFNLYGISLALHTYDESKEVDVNNIGMCVCVFGHAEGQVPPSSLASTMKIVVCTDAIQIFSDYKWQHEYKNQEETPPTRFSLCLVWQFLKISKCAFRSLHVCVCVPYMYACVCLFIDFGAVRNVCTRRVTYTPACATVSMQLHTQMYVCAFVYMFMRVCLYSC